MNNTNTFNSFYDIEDIKLKSEKYIDCIEEVGNFFSKYYHENTHYINPSNNKAIKYKFENIYKKKNNKSSIYYLKINDFINLIIDYNSNISKVDFIKMMDEIISKHYLSNFDIKDIMSSKYLNNDINRINNLINKTVNTTNFNNKTLEFIYDNYNQIELDVSILFSKVMDRINLEGKSRYNPLKDEISLDLLSNKNREMYDELFFKNKRLIIQTIPSELFVKRLMVNGNYVDDFENSIFSKINDLLINKVLIDKNYDEDFFSFNNFLINNESFVYFFMKNKNKFELDFNINLFIQKLSCYYNYDNNFNYKDNILNLLNNKLIFNFIQENNLDDKVNKKTENLYYQNNERNKYLLSELANNELIQLIDNKDYSGFINFIKNNKHFFSNKIIIHNKNFIKNLFKYNHKSFDLMFKFTLESNNTTFFTIDIVNLYMDNNENNYINKINHIYSLISNNNSLYPAYNLKEINEIILEKITSIEEFNFLYKNMYKYKDIIDFGEYKYEKFFNKITNNVIKNELFEFIFKNLLNSNNNLNLDNKESFLSLIKINEKNINCILNTIENEKNINYMFSLFINLYLKNDEEKEVLKIIEKNLLLKYDFNENDFLLFFKEKLNNCVFNLNENIIIFILNNFKNINKNLLNFKNIKSIGDEIFEYATLYNNKEILILLFNKKYDLLKSINEKVDLEKLLFNLDKLFVLFDKNEYLLKIIENDKKNIFFKNINFVSNKENFYSESNSFIKSHSNFIKESNSVFNYNKLNIVNINLMEFFALFSENDNKNNLANYFIKNNLNFIIKKYNPYDLNEISNNSLIFLSKYDFINLYDNNVKKEIINKSIKNPVDLFNVTKDIKDLFFKKNNLINKLNNQDDTFKAVIDKNFENNINDFKSNNLIINRNDEVQLLNELFNQLINLKFNEIINLNLDNKQKFIYDILDIEEEINLHFNIYEKYELYNKLKNCYLISLINHNLFSDTNQVKEKLDNLEKTSFINIDDNELTTGIGYVNYLNDFLSNITLNNNQNILFDKTEFNDKVLNYKQSLYIKNKCKKKNIKI